MSTLPSNLPSVSRAKLPAVYQNAKTAISKCDEIDECKDWADKAEALASYAKQAQDEELRKMADRIQARAIRRCGELLQKIERGVNQHARSGAGPSRTEAARDAGLSRRQKRDSLRVARVPAAEFDDAVDSDDPPTVTKLSEQGKLASSFNLHGRSPQDFKAATATLGWLRSVSEFCDEHTAESVVAGFLPKELKRKHVISTQAEAIRSWLKTVSRLLAKESP